MGVCSGRDPRQQWRWQLSRMGRGAATSRRAGAGLRSEKGQGQGKASMVWGHAWAQPEARERGDGAVSALTGMASCGGYMRCSAAEAKEKEGTDGGAHRGDKGLVGEAQEGQELAGQRQP